ncbi:MAG: CoA transferase [Pseudomonadota bacterium]
MPEFTVSNYIRERSGSVLPNVAPSNIYHCRDGEMIIAANQDTVFARLCKAIGRIDLVTDERYADHTARGAHQEELDNLIDAWSQNHTMDQVEQTMVEHGVPCGKVYRAPEMLDDPHFEAREAIVDVDHPKWDTLKMQNVFPKLSATPGRVRWIGPELGEHTQEVYQSLLDLTPDEMEDLGQRGII